MKTERRRKKKRKTTQNFLLVLAVAVAVGQRGRRDERMGRERKALICFVSVFLAVYVVFFLSTLNLDAKIGKTRTKNEQRSLLFEWPCFSRMPEARTQVVSWSPRVVVFRNFLSDWECDYLVSITDPEQERVDG